METIKNIAAIIGCILSFASLITLCTKGGRSFIAKIIKLNTKELEEMNKSQNDNINEIKVSLDNLTNQISTLCNQVNVLEGISSQQCRDVIKNIYYKYCHVKKIPLYERKTVEKTYQNYQRCSDGKNTYATLLYNEINKWEIDESAPAYIEED